MRRFKAGDKTITLNERDYKQLLNRFDLSRVKQLRIEIDCICVQYPSCISCPFEDVENEDGCKRVLGDLGLYPRHTRLTSHFIFWPVQYDTEARKEITAIRDFLLSLERR